MKLVEVKATKEFASTFLNDIFFRMAVNRVLDAAPGFELVRCKECKHCGSFDENGIALCFENGRFCHAEGYCDDGERETE
jgi:hypothetical protein